MSVIVSNRGYFSTDAISTTEDTIASGSSRTIDSVNSNSSTWIVDLTDGQNIERYIISAIVDNSGNITYTKFSRIGIRFNAQESVLYNGTNLEFQLTNNEGFQLDVRIIRVAHENV